MKNQFKNAKSQFEQAKIPPENPKTQFENAKTQKTAQVLAQVFLDRRSKKSPAIVSTFINRIFNNKICILMPFVVKMIELQIFSSSKDLLTTSKADPFCL